MPATMLILALIAAAVWAGMLLAWHGFWRADQRLPSGLPLPEEAPAVAAVIPARNETASIGPVLLGHSLSRYPGPFTVTLVDDGSTDDTRARAQTIAGSAQEGRIRILEGAPLPPGWSGKLWALSQGVDAVAQSATPPRWLLLTDADIVHAPETLSRLVAFAEAEGLAMVSLMARLETGSRLGRLLVPAYVFFFQKLYPFPAVNRPSSWIAGAAGGCVLVRRDALEEIGGIAAIRGALIDDCTLAARIKRGPPRRAIWLGLADREVVSLRDTGRLATIWETVARTAFPQLQRSWALLALCTLGMALIYLVPVAAVVFGPVLGLWPALAGLLAWGLMGIAFWPTLKLYGGRPWEAALLPIAAVLYMAMTLDSGRRDLIGRASPWKGRTYSGIEKG
ncbi:MAG: glycosyltransferase [Pseudomonadota bacterium]